MHTVHLRALDAATGRPTPVRLRLTDAQGRYYPPFGRLATFTTEPGVDVGGQVMIDGRAWAYIDGACEVRLPPGRITVEIHKGPEYSPIVRDIALAAGQLALRFQVERCAPSWAESGWYPADFRAHDLPPEAAALEGEAEGLALVHLLARPRPGAIPNLLAFTGDRPPAPAGCQVSVNTLNVHPALGTVALLNCHRVVYPLRAGGPDSDDFWSVADWCDQCHRKKGLVTWPDLPDTPREAQAEALAALVLGKIDAFEVTSAGSLGLYHRLLNCGLRPALVGASGKDSNGRRLGQVRTYIQADEAALPAWTEAVRAGRTYVTAGPRLALRVGDRQPGGRVAVAAEAAGLPPGGRLEVLANGAVAGATESARLETEMICNASTWVAARCTGAAFAHTTPAFLDIPGRPLRPAADTLAPLLTSLDAGLAWARGAAFACDRWRGHLAEVLTAARARLAALGRDAA